MTSAATDCTYGLHCDCKITSLHRGRQIYPSPVEQYAGVGIIFLVGVVSL